MVGRFCSRLAGRGVPRVATRTATQRRGYSHERLAAPLRKTNVLARVHLKVQIQGILNVRLDHFLHEFHENGVFAKDCVLVHRLKIDGDEERPRQFGVDPFPALDAQDLGDFQKLHARIHHHRLHASGRDLGLEFIENDVMNHEGKANRRFQRGAQVRIHCPNTAGIV